MAGATAEETSGDLRFTREEADLALRGRHHVLHGRLGPRPVTMGGAGGAWFAVMAAGADSVSVTGDFAHGEGGAELEANPFLEGLWEGFVPGAARGSAYMYSVRRGAETTPMTDPFALATDGESPVVWEPEYVWGDANWLTGRLRANSLSSPMAVYSVDPGCWMCGPEEGERRLTLRELTPRLEEHLVETGFTHLELLFPHVPHAGWAGPLAHPSASEPEDLMYLVDRLHRVGVGVYAGVALDTPESFSGLHPGVVKSASVSRALVWLDRFHMDGLSLRVSSRALSSPEGGPDAVDTVKALNESAYGGHPEVQSVAKVSGDGREGLSGVTRPVYAGGLGFGMKLASRWASDVTGYFTRDPLFRKYDHDLVTVGPWYVFTESHLLALAHPDLPSGAGSLIERMPGDDWQKRANLRSALGFMYAHPGKKLIHMGDEFGHRGPREGVRTLDWRLPFDPAHGGLRRWVGDLNRVYRGEPALYGQDCRTEGFEWVDYHDRENSVVAFLRKCATSDDLILAVMNFTPVPRRNYRVGVPRGGSWKELLNSDAPVYGGSGMGNFGEVDASPVGAHERPHALSLTLPPLSVMLFKSSGERD